MKLIKIQRGDIWVVNLEPTIGHELRKIRPAVVIQNDLGNQRAPTTIVAPIKSETGGKIYPFEVLLSEKTKGLSTVSKVLLDQIRVVDKTRLMKKLGTVNEYELE